MNKGLQKHQLRETLRARGVDPTTVDVDAYIDPQLHLDENIRNMEEKGVIPPEDRDLGPRQVKREEEGFLERQDGPVCFERQEPSGKFAPCGSRPDRDVPADRGPQGKFVSPEREETGLTRDRGTGMLEGPGSFLEDDII
jgi:hypothetical protein